MGCGKVIRKERGFDVDPFSAKSLGKAACRGECSRDHRLKKLARVRQRTRLVFRSASSDPFGLTRELLTSAKNRARASVSELTHCLLREVGE
jgi:hypothetical protein